MGLMSVKPLQQASQTCTLALHELCLSCKALSKCQTCFRYVVSGLKTPLCQGPLTPGLLPGVRRSWSTSIALLMCCCTYQVCPKSLCSVSAEKWETVVLPLKRTWLAYSTSRTAVWQDNFRRALFVKPIFSLSKWGSTNGLNRRSISNFLWKWCSDLSNVAKGLWKGCPKGKNCIQVVPAFLERLKSQRRM